MRAIVSSNYNGSETHGFAVKALRKVTVPLFNGLPERIVRQFLSLSPDGATIMGRTGSATALEVMYRWHEKDPFTPGVFSGCANLFWNHIISQPMAMRNRLRIVQKTLKAELAKCLCKSADPIQALSLGGGSSRALIQSLSELRPLAIHGAVKVINVDKDQDAIALGRQLAAEHGVEDIFRWVTGNSKDLGSLVDDNSVAIVEMVGLFDYFSDRIGEMILRRIYRKLRPSGVLVLGNVHPHEEMAFVSKMGWPAMYYRRPADLARLTVAAGFRNLPEIVLEPLGIHMIACARK